MSFVAFGASAQFKLDADDYFKQKKKAEEEKRIQDSIRQAQFEEQQIKANDIRFRMHWENWITYRQNVGFIESSYNISYYGYLKTKSVWTYPISLRLSSTTKYNDANLKEGYTGWSQHITYLGMNGFRSIADNFYVSLGGAVPLGWENYRLVEDDGSYSRRHIHFLTGLSAEERIFYMSPNRVGLVIGAGIYQRTMTSRRYWFDPGLTFEVGLKF